MKKYVVVSIAVMLCLSMSSMAVLVGTDGSSRLGFEGPLNEAWVHNGQKECGWKIRDADISGKYTDFGVTQGLTSLELVVATGGMQEAIGIGLWRVINQVKVAPGITMDVTMRNDGGQIPDGWLQFELVFNSNLTGWTQIAGTGLGGVPLNPRTDKVTFTFTETLITKLNSGSVSWGDMMIRTNNGAQGATFWIDNIQTIPEPATMLILALGGLMAFKRK